MLVGQVSCSKRLATPDAGGTGVPICTGSVVWAEDTAHETTTSKSWPYSGILILLWWQEKGDINTSSEPPFQAWGY